MCERDVARNRDRFLLSWIVPNLGQELREQHGVQISDEDVHALIEEALERAALEWGVATTTHDE